MANRRCTQTLHLQLASANGHPKGQNISASFIPHYAERPRRALPAFGKHTSNRADCERDEKQRNVPKFHADLTSRSALLCLSHGAEQVAAVILRSILDQVKKAGTCPNKESCGGVTVPAARRTTPRARRRLRCDRRHKTEYDEGPMHRFKRSGRVRKRASPILDRQGADLATGIGPERGIAMDLRAFVMRAGQGRQGEYSNRFQGDNRCNVHPEKMKKGNHHLPAPFGGYGGFLLNSFFLYSTFFLIPSARGAQSGRCTLRTRCGVQTHAVRSACACRAESPAGVRPQFLLKPGGVAVGMPAGDARATKSRLRLRSNRPSCRQRVG